MRGPIRKELISCFNREFQPRFPQFIPGLKDRTFWTWDWEVATNLTLFITLTAFDNYDRFAIEVAWNEGGEFSWGGIGAMQPDLPAGRIRVAVPPEDGGVLCHWDLAPEATAAIRERNEARVRGEPLSYDDDTPIEQILPRVQPMVHDAIEKLEQYGVPLLRRVAEARGLNWGNE